MCGAMLSVFISSRSLLAVLPLRRKNLAALGMKRIACLGAIGATGTFAARIVWPRPDVSELQSPRSVKQPERRQVGLAHEL